MEMDADRMPSHPQHAQGQGTTSTASHDGELGTQIPVLEPHDADSSGKSLNNREMGQDVYQQIGGGQPPLLLDGASGAEDRPEVEFPFEIDLQDNEALLSLNKELESILDPKVPLIYYRNVAPPPVLQPHPHNVAACASYIIIDI